MSSEKDRIFLAALKYCLDQKVKTRKELCEITGIYSGRLSQIINGKYSTGNKIQEKIAEAFGYKIDKFLSFGRGLIEKTSIDSPAANSLEETVSAQKITIETQAKYIAFLERENARLNNILGSVEQPAKKQTAPNVRILGALGEELAEE